MQWYSLTDIAEAYSITCDMRKHKIKSGQLKAEKLFMGKSRTRNFKYIIPENELSKLEEYKQCEPTSSPDAHPNYYENLRRERKEQQEQARVKAQRRREEWLSQHPRLKYYDYLHSEEWQAKRLQALVRDNFRCQLCGSGTNVQVHHINYENLHTDAELDDLVTLCKACHEKVHSTDLQAKFEKQTSDMHTLAVSLLQENMRAEAWQKFENACEQHTPPLSAQEVSRIWQNALKVVCPL